MVTASQGTMSSARVEYGSVQNRNLRKRSRAVTEFYKRKVEKKDNPLYNEQILFISPPGDIQPFRQRLHSSMPVKVPSGYGNARNNVLIQSAYNVELFTMIAHILTTAKRFALGFMLALCTFATAATAANTETPIPSFITLCYHNVVPALGNGILDDTAPVSQEELKTHFDWLKENGYHIISVKDVLKAKETGKEQFTVPFDRQSLADYLGVARSAMCAELSRMRRDGWIDYHKNVFRIQKAAFAEHTEESR